MRVGLRRTGVLARRAFRYEIVELCFFFQAEDGIRDRTVTGVQTCALPISAFMCFRGLSVSDRHVLIKLDLICTNSAAPLGPEPDIGMFALPILVSVSE